MIQCGTVHLKVIKEAKNVLGLLTSFYCCSLSIAVPHRIAVEHITVNVLRIYFDVSSSCPLV